MNNLIFSASNELSLDLKLYGIVKGPYCSYALLKSGTKFLFLKEKERFGNFLIEKIYKNKVKIDEINSEKKFYLFFTGNSKRFEEKSAVKKILISDQKEKVLTIRRRKIETYLKNLDSILYSAKATPYFENGQIKGFKLTLIEKGSLIEKMGIREGDVIYSVNGRVLRGLDDVLYFLNSIYKLNEIRLGIIRNGKRNSLIFKIKG